MSLLRAKYSERKKQILQIPADSGPSFEYTDVSAAKSKAQPNEAAINSAPKDVEGTSSLLSKTYVSTSPNDQSKRRRSPVGLSSAMPLKKHIKDKRVASAYSAASNATDSSDHPYPPNPADKNYSKSHRPPSSTMPLSFGPPPTALPRRPTPSTPTTATLPIHPRPVALAAEAEGLYAPTTDRFTPQYGARSEHYTKDLRLQLTGVPPRTTRELLIVIGQILLVPPIHTDTFTFPIETHFLMRQLRNVYKGHRVSKLLMQMETINAIVKYLANGLPAEGFEGNTGGYADGNEDAYTLVRLYEPTLEVEAVGPIVMIRSVYTDALMGLIFTEYSFLYASHIFLQANPFPPNTPHPPSLPYPPSLPHPIGNKDTTQPLLRRAYPTPSLLSVRSAPNSRLEAYKRMTHPHPYNTFREATKSHSTWDTAYGDTRGGGAWGDEKQSNLDLEALVNAPSAREQQLLDTGVELRQLLSEPTARQTMTARGFQNKEGTQLREICIHGTQEECCRAQQSHFPCEKVHFRRIILAHTDPSLGDCSYLDTCRNIETCKFVHYEVDRGRQMLSQGKLSNPYDIGTVSESSAEDTPAQWIRCDIRKFDLSVLRYVKAKVVMADPPWDIHMDLPYGTMTDQEMRSLQVDQIQQEGLLFLWVTGRAMELARECMELWGYRRVEEIVWVKTNQLQRVIRTGRTGHWLNHSKDGYSKHPFVNSRDGSVEHCLVGMKGNPQVNKNLDCDVIVSEVRETSRKPNEIYRLIERLCPNGLKVELFGRQHNVRNNWITLGNQLKGVQLHHPILREKFSTLTDIKYNGYPNESSREVPDEMG